MYMLVIWSFVSWVPVKTAIVAAAPTVTTIPGFTNSGDCATAAQVLTSFSGQAESGGGTLSVAATCFLVK
jgi:hypothetical protein